jgi:hypothetical protein
MPIGHGANHVRFFLYLARSCNRLLIKDPEEEIFGCAGKKVFRSSNY